MVLNSRVSRDRQDVGLSVAAHLQALRDYAKSKDYSVAGESVDEAEREMIDEGCRNKVPFEPILIWGLSRFTHKREHAVGFKSILRCKGIRVVSITEHADDSPTGKLMGAIIESMDEFYPVFGPDPFIKRHVYNCHYHLSWPGEL